MSNTTSLKNIPIYESATFSTFLSSLYGGLPKIVTRWWETNILAHRGTHFSKMTTALWCIRQDLIVAVEAYDIYIHIS